MSRPAPRAGTARPLHPGAAGAWDGRRVGLLGGSFNPAHAGHRHISREALKRLHLDEVWWLVSPQNPLKPVSGMAPLAERLATARNVADDPRIRVTDIEVLLGTRYTVETLEALRARFRRTRFVWLMGADNLAQIPRWRRWTTIFRLVPVAVFARRPYLFRAIGGLAATRFARFRRPASEAATLADRRPPAWIFLPSPLHPASATALRALRDGAAPSGAKAAGPERRAALPAPHP